MYMSALSVVRSGSLIQDPSAMYTYASGADSPMLDSLLRALAQLLNSIFVCCAGRLFGVFLLLPMPSGPLIQEPHDACRVI